MTTPTHPGSDYYVNDVSGTIQAQANPLLAAGLIASGWAGPFTWAQAKAQVASNPSTAVKAPVAAVGQAGASAASGVSGVTDFLTRLTQGNTWIRVAEVLLGLGLIIVGLAKLASGTAAGRAAVKAGKAAAIL
jgi:hypothetical protein